VHWEKAEIINGFKNKLIGILIVLKMLEILVIGVYILNVI